MKSNGQKFEKWAGFHDDAENSTCISPKKKSTSESQKEWPEEVSKAIEDNLYVSNLFIALFDLIQVRREDYLWLNERRLRL